MGMIVPGDGDGVPWPEIRSRYVAWAERAGQSPMGDRALQRAMTEAGFETASQRIGSCVHKVRRGLRLRGSGDA
jgi:hypothetical protein